MIVIKLFLLAVLLVPVLFVIGTVISSADALVPLTAGAYQDGLCNIVQAGEGLRAVTKELATKEISFCVQFIQNLQIHPAIFEEAERLQRIKAQAEASI